VKAKRKAFVARAARTPTVRKIKPAIQQAPPRTPGLSLPASSMTAKARPAGRGSAPPASGPGAGLSTGAGSAAASVSAASGADPSLDMYGGRPVRLEVDLGAGLVLQNPLIVAAGPFGYGAEMADACDLPRLGGLTTRGTTLKPRGGHPAPRTAEVTGGLLLGMGLQNPGLDQVIERYAETWAKWEIPVILNLCGESVAELADAARRLEGLSGVAAVELNLSCANASRGAAFGLEPSSAASAVSAVRRACDLPLIAKLTAAASDIRAVARAVEDAGADVISAINTLPGLLVAADRLGPALGSGYGGVSGPALKPVALRVVFEVAQSVKIPVIGIGGIATLDDVLDMLAVGAEAVGIGVAALADPMLPVRLADELADACRDRGIGDVRDLTGTALPRKPAPSSTRGAEYAR
jgi:dihydroorotate dehydrogenase (NAD+) catalytic subunit